LQPDGHKTRQITVSPLGTTVYTLTARCFDDLAHNNLLCFENVTITVTVNPGFSATITANDVSCNNNGSTCVNVSGGTNPIIYNWSNGGTTSCIYGLSSGTYVVTVQDQTGCFKTLNGVVDYHSVLASAGVNKTGCINSDLILGGEPTANDGTSPYTYSWTPNVSAGPSGTALCAGPYTVSVADNLNCVKFVTFTLTAPATLSATPTQTNLVCNSACIGAIKLNPSGGTGAYTYSWSPFLPSIPTVTALCAGAYSYTVTDAVSCTYTNVVTITEPPAVTLTVNNTDVTCFGACNGTATGNVSGGTGAFTFSWSPGNPIGQGTNAITGLCPGT